MCSGGLQWDTGLVPAWMIPERGLDCRIDPYCCCICAGKDFIYEGVCADVGGKANRVEATQCVLSLAMLILLLFFFLCLV